MARQFFRIEIVVNVTLALGGLTMDRYAFAGLAVAFATIATTVTLAITGQVTLALLTLMAGGLVIGNVADAEQESLERKVDEIELTIDK